MDKEFSITKKGYDKGEVDEFVKKTAAINASLREHIEELTKRLNDSEAQLLSLRQKQDLIVRSIMGAVQKAEQIEALTRQKYEFDMEQLKAFHERWVDYYNKLIARFPLDSQLKGLNNFNRNMFRLLGDGGRLDNKLMGSIDNEISLAQRQFLSESARLGGKNPPIAEENAPDADIDSIPVFNPEETIRKLIRRQIEEESGKKRRKSKDKPDTDAPADSADKEGQAGFSYEEALNPKQDLAEILKDLGLTLN